jgi:hypothetical protein
MVGRLAPDGVRTEPRTVLAIGVTDRRERTNDRSQVADAQSPLEWWKHELRNQRGLMPFSLSK